MILFIFATCVPALLIAFAAVFAGPWPVLAMVSLTMMVAGLDHLVAKVSSPQNADRDADRLSVALAVIHLALVPLVVWALAADHLSSMDKVFLFIATGIFCGQVSNANAHELIHRRTRGLFRLGVWVYSSMLFGHHASAHLLIHHRHVGTPRDPGTARLGQSYYRYVLEAWGGAFRDGWAAETQRLAQVQRPWTDHPYLRYAGISLLFMFIAFVVGGGVGIVWFVGLAVFAQQQLLLCDYVQHYGLKRQSRDDGRFETVGDHHSWNAPHWYSSGMMLNAPRHSDHHAHPNRPFPALDLPENGPTLPRSLPVMAVLALFPPAWRRVMDHRARRWQLDPTM